MNHIIIYAMPRSRIFVQNISKRKYFENNLFNTKYVSNVSTNFSESFFIISRIERGLKEMYIGLHVKYPLLFPIFMKLEFSRQIFEKS